MKPSPSILKVFVYGTLKPGERNYQRFCLGKVQSEIPCYTKAILYNLPLGYPAMIEGENKVQGFLLTFGNADLLNSLDRLEGYQPQRNSSLNEYYRRMVAVYNPEDEYLDEAWAYFMTLGKIKKYQGTIITSGNWV